MTPPEAGLGEPAAPAESREARERAAIVARYDRGHAPGAIIDAWEDPKLEIYHVTDRYGFIQYVRRGPRTPASVLISTGGRRQWIPQPH